MYDYSTAERNTAFDLIPAKTTAPISIQVLAGNQGTPENAFVVTKSGLLQLVLECTITEGEYAGRKIWHRLTTGAQPGTQLTEGQEKGINIGKQTLRAILEAARGFAPTDDSSAAIEARKMKTIHELDGMEVCVEIGIEKDKTGEYGDKNKIARILPAKAPAVVGSGARTAAVNNAIAAKRGW